MCNETWGINDLLVFGCYSNEIYSKQPVGSTISCLISLSLSLSLEYTFQSHIYRSSSKTHCTLSLSVLSILMCCAALEVVAF